MSLAWDAGLEAVIAPNFHDLKFVLNILHQRRRKIRSIEPLNR
jgi:hypothetical protein